MKILQANKFSKRSDLESVVKGYEEIRGTRAELVRLGLDDRTKVFNVPCVITDTPTEEKEVKPRPNRGKIYDSKINNQVIIKNA